jgi:hypothetical protein
MFDIGVAMRFRLINYASFRSRVAVRAVQSRGPTRPIPGFSSCVGVSGRIRKRISNSVGISGRNVDLSGGSGWYMQDLKRISVGSGGSTSFDPKSARCNGPNTYLYFKQQKTRYICFKHGDLLQIYHELPSGPLCIGPNSTITPPTQFARYMNRAGSLISRVGPPTLNPLGQVGRTFWLNLQTIGRIGLNMRWPPYF